MLPGGTVTGMRVWRSGVTALFREAVYAQKYAMPAYVNAAKAFYPCRSVYTTLLLQ